MDDEITMVVELDSTMALCVIAQIQLASRHPGNKGQSTEIAQKFARGLQVAVTKLHPEVANILEKGWDPAYDVEG